MIVTVSFLTGDGIFLISDFSEVTEMLKLL
jgi:hypothetical protein